MKKAILLIAAAAMAASATIASAQPSRGRGDDGRNTSQFRPGQQLDNRYRSNDHVVSDFGRYRLSAPPRGYAYYRTDSGDIVLAAIASGVISSVIADALLGDNSGYGSPSYGYPQYYPAPPSYGGQIYYDAYGRPYTVDRYGRSVWVY